MNFIKKIVDKNIDKYVHIQFQKFSRGEFRERAIINAKHSGKKYTIKTSAEFANELVMAVAKKLAEEKSKVTGAVVSTNDLTGELDFSEKKQFQGVKRYIIDKEMSGNEILKLLEKFPKSFFALSFNSEKDETSLKIKPKAPKSGKPKTSPKEDEESKADFCKLTTKDSEIGKSFVFEKEDFKEATIKHDFIIEKIIIPEELKNEKDFSKIREMSKRKGKIIRTAKIDGQETKKEIEFEA